MIVKNTATIVICDDIRQETNGKHILIGVYGGNILVPEANFSLQLCMWIEFIATSCGTETMHIRVSYAKNVIVVMKAELEINEIGPMAVATPGVPVQGASEGDVVIEISSDGQNWKEIKRKSVRKGAVAGAPQLTIPPPAG
jgi:hypothetical protein